MRFLLACFLACVPLSQPCRAATIFSDNFNAGAKPDWGNESGHWRAVHGTYDATTPGNGNAFPVTYSGVDTHADLTNFSVRLAVKDLNDGGVWLRSAYNGGAINGVLLVTGGDSGTYSGFYWHIVQNGSFSPPMNAAPYAGAQGANLKLRIDVKGSTYSLYVGGAKTPLTSVTTTAFASGAVGLYDYSPNSGASSPRGQVFDNVTISSVVK